jgi:hypothetical protein
MSGAAFPLTHSARPVGWEGSGSSALNRPPMTVAVAPHAETHIRQNVATCRLSRSSFTAAPGRRVSHARTARATRVA